MPSFFQIGIVGVRDVEVDDLIRCDFASAMGTVCVLLQGGYQDAANCVLISTVQMVSLCHPP